MAGSAQAQHSVARLWNEECLEAIRMDFPAPTVHSRNLFHVSVAMYDAWAAYDADATGALHHEAASAADVETARDEAISYAAYRVLSYRYALSVNAAAAQASFDALMGTLGYDPEVTTTAGPSPAAVGNRAAAAVLAFGQTDGANEAQRYMDTTGYIPVNDPLDLTGELPFTLDDPNRWQPLAFEVAFTQNGLEADKVQTFVGPHWGYVTPFALGGAWADGVFAEIDPGIPPLLGGPGEAIFQANNVEVIRFSSQLDPDSGEWIDISPGSYGNNPPGQNDGTGHPLNPATGEPYPPSLVRVGDFGRAIAEYWADGPQSETPPGHWNTLANTVSDHPALVKRIGGLGPVVGDLEWDVKLYFALNAAVHDAAIAAWGVKGYYDYVRPISSIRYMGMLGQSTDPGLPSYHPRGLPLAPGLIEVVTAASSTPGGRHAHLSGSVGRVAIYSWAGEPNDPETEYRGSEWILAERWVPYQRSTFVTPAFAGYVSGHSTFSRAAAEVMTAYTGSAFFPGGLMTHTVPPGGLEFEAGPIDTVVLQWATYYDASDQAGISRLYGGIHVAADDGTGRIIGSHVGQSVYDAALSYWYPAFRGGVSSALIPATGGTELRLSWRCMPEFLYEVQRCNALPAFSEAIDVQHYIGFEASVIVPAADSAEFYRVIRR